MVLGEIKDKAKDAALPILERATQMHFCLHFLCAYLYAEVALFLAFHRSIFSYKWGDFDALTPAYWALLVLGYFFLAGYAFKIVAGIVQYWARMAHIRFSSPKWEDELHRQAGWVPTREVLKRAYEKDSGELVRQVEERVQICRKESIEASENAYLALLTIFLYCANWIVVSGGTIDWLKALTSPNIFHSVVFFLSLPLFGYIWFYAADDYSRRNYIYHRPIYDEIEGGKKERPYS